MYSCTWLVTISAINAFQRKNNPKNFRKVGEIEPFQKRRDTEKGGDN